MMTVNTPSSKYAWTPVALHQTTKHHDFFADGSFSTDQHDISMNLDRKFVN